MATSVIQDALALLRDQSVPQAIDRLEAAVVETPAYPAAYVLLARAYESRNEWDAARSAWDQAFVLMPHSPTVQQGRHRIRTRIRQQRRADDAPPASAAPEPAAPESDSASPPADERGVAAPDDTPPSLSMDEGPTDLETLRAQTEQSARQQHAASAPSADDLSSPSDAVNDLDDNLDRLIEELQSARIQPDPDIDDLPTPDLDDDIEDMVSETLARIYASQGAYHEAARVYVQLAAQEPDRSEELLREASRMRQHARSSNASDSEDDSAA